MRDIDFLSGRFFDLEIPAEHAFLLKYFRGDFQVAFLRYYLTFGSFKHFTDHTGYHCAERVMFKLLRRYRHLTKIHEEAKRALTEEGMELVFLIESGKYPLTGEPKS
jgi:hypothetical protein